jgi:histone H3/H4
MKTFVRMVREIEQHDVISSGIFGDEFRDKGHREWTKQALKSLEEATESYMVQVISEALF